MRALEAIVVAGLGLTLLAACQTQQVDASPPTVTYRYDDPDDLDEVALRADDYCEDRYGRDARLVDRDRTYDGGIAVFACD